jgi:hypothetical protein
MRPHKGTAALAGSCAAQEVADKPECWPDTAQSEPDMPSLSCFVRIAIKRSVSSDRCWRLTQLHEQQLMLPWQNIIILSADRARGRQEGREGGVCKHLGSDDDCLD